jgi:hypothetical protein
MPNKYSDKLYLLTDEDIEILWECIGLSVEELEDMKEEYDRKTQTSNKERSQETSQPQA